MSQTCEKSVPATTAGPGHDIMQLVAFAEKQQLVHDAGQNGMILNAKQCDNPPFLKLIDRPDKTIDESDDEFCKESKKGRTALYQELSKELLERSLYKMKDIIMEGLTQCVLLCGGDEKLKQRWCEYFLKNLNYIIPIAPKNWINRFSLHRTSQLPTQELACPSDDSMFCLKQSELFALMEPIYSAEFTIKKADTKITQKIYHSGSNPSPLQSLLTELYAMEVSGIVVVFVRTQGDLTNLKAAIRNLALYNKKVDAVDIRVQRGVFTRLEPVIEYIEGEKSLWKLVSCVEKPIIRPIKVKWA
eukprot:m.334068 g.334068  ORF g.334068 m.334068 type:complete len:302 (-) comp17280_c0_seq1:98-1003(-)